MPRASDYLLAGYTHHLTHRCHERRHLLRFVQDRDIYRGWLREGVQRHGVAVYGYCITCNHVHVLAHVDSVEAVSALMHLASGATAKQYNIRKARSGAMWEHPYQCTAIQDGRHLLNCLVYINLNMVRAGVVSHPGKWRWCSHDELTGSRKRYRILNMPRLLESLDLKREGQLRDWYEDAVQRRLTQDRLRREPDWTESLAVGTEDFVKSAVRQHGKRWVFELKPLASESGSGWTVRETGAAYDPETPPGNHSLTT